ncbi:hypothetical protein HAX54_008991, partial [Datura stramonium]|nr:hypothetical protein [Datura stramonium]
MEAELQMMPIEERLSIENLAIVLMNLDADEINGGDEIVHALAGMRLYTYSPKKIVLQP